MLAAVMLLVATLEHEEQVTMKDLATSASVILVATSRAPGRKVEAVTVKAGVPPFRRTSYLYRVERVLKNTAGWKQRREVVVHEASTEAEVARHVLHHTEGIDESPVRPVYVRTSSAAGGRLILFLVTDTHGDLELAAAGAVEPAASEQALKRMLPR